jgi:alanine dehydrogenase
MQPGSVIVDVAIDQGGCIATSRETTHTAPVITRHGVQHDAWATCPEPCPTSPPWLAADWWTRSPIGLSWCLG